MLIRSTIKRVGLSDYCLEIKEDKLTEAPVTIFKGYYGSERDAEEARDQARLGISIENPNMPMCEESEKYSILIRRNGYWKFGPYWDKDIFSINVEIDQHHHPRDLPVGTKFDASGWYTVEHYRRVYLFNIVTYPITLYAVDPEELVEENLDMLKTLLDRLRPKRQRW